MVGPSVKNAMTNSSSDSVNASSAPATMPGASVGSVMRRKVVSRAGAEVARRLLQRGVDVRQPGAHDGRRRTPMPNDGVREQHRVQAERSAETSA